VTHVREKGFSVDLPGTWARAESEQPGSLVYRDTSGAGILTVMLLAVRPAYSIADRGRLHSDYMQHRAKFERGQLPSLEQSDPVSKRLGDTIEGSWDAVDVVSGRRQLHRVMLDGSVLADFCYEDQAPDEAAFADLATGILGSAAIIADAPDDAGAEPGPN